MIIKILSVVFFGVPAVDVISSTISFFYSRMTGTPVGKKKFGIKDFEFWSIGALSVSIAARITYGLFW